MQVAPPRGGSPVKLAERSSAGNDNKPRVAKCAEPVLPQEEGRSLRVLKVTNEKVPRLLSSASTSLKLYYCGRSRWPVRQRQREGSGAGGLQLGAGE